MTSSTGGAPVTGYALVTGYAPVNGLSMYYELHGTGRPLVVLHGAYMSTDSMAPLVTALAADRQVIAVDLQAHGRTADVDRPIRYEHMADDTAALMRHLQIAKADVLGYSMGGATALQLALRHPELVERLVVVSAAFRSDGGYAEMFEMIETITPEVFAGTPWLEAYERIAPRPSDFPTLVEKLKALDLETFAWPSEGLKAITSPAMVVIGDSDATRPEHAVEMFRLFGGGVMGDLAGLPKAQLAVLPGTSHVGIMERIDWLAPMVRGFLDAPRDAPRDAPQGRPQDAPQGADQTSP